MIHNIDLDILKYISTRDNYDDLKGVISKSLCTKESWQLVTDFGEYFNQHPNVTEIDQDFKMWMRVTRHPGWKVENHQLYGTIIDNVLDTVQPDRAGFFEQITNLKLTETIKDIVEELKEGSATATDTIQKITSLEKQIVSSSSEEELTLESISDREGGGLYWRLEDLNKSVGPLDKGDLVIVAKRPEVGGTSFLVSEMSFMLEQLGTDEKAVVFNNEEAPAKVYSRMVSSALNVDYRTMMSAPAVYQQRYNDWLDGREWTLVHDTSMTVGSIHRKLKEKDYSLIGINVLLKVGGTGKKEDHDKLQELGEECRRIAQQYGPVIVIVQADPSAEGMEFIPQDRIYKSKTALQGEADALIMIGKGQHANETQRTINVAKNKIPPAPCAETRYKHLKSEVEFAPDTGRFTSVNFEGNSRDNANVKSNSNSSGSGNNS